MSTHNIGFYEEISKIIIKYAPYFFCCVTIMLLSFRTDGFGQTLLTVKTQIRWSSLIRVFIVCFSFSIFKSHYAMAECTKSMLGDGGRQQSPASGVPDVQGEICHVCS